MFGIPVGCNDGLSDIGLLLLGESDIGFSVGNGVIGRSVGCNDGYGVTGLNDGCLVVGDSVVRRTSYVGDVVGVAAASVAAQHDMKKRKNGTKLIN